MRWGYPKYWRNGWYEPITLRDHPVTGISYFDAATCCVVNIIIDDDIFLVYGYGNNPEEALNEYLSSLLELYRILAVGAESNPFDHEQFTYLQSYIQPNIVWGFNAVQADRD